MKFLKKANPRQKIKTHINTNSEIPLHTLKIIHEQFTTTSHIVQISILISSKIRIAQIMCGLLVYQRHNNRLKAKHRGQLVFECNRLD